MPKPKGWTAAMLRKRDRIVKGLLKRGVKESRAYAIATSLVKRKARKK